MLNTHAVKLTTSNAQLCEGTLRRFASPRVLTSMVWTDTIMNARVHVKAQNGEDKKTLTTRAMMVACAVEGGRRAAVEMPQE